MKPVQPGLFRLDPAAEICQLHREITEHLQTSLEKAIRIGQMLTEQKASLPHGDFGPWVAANLPFTDRTARSYMRFYRERDLLKTENVSVLSDASRLLATAKPSAWLPDVGEITIGTYCTGKDEMRTVYIQRHENPEFARWYQVVFTGKGEDDPSWIEGSWRGMHIDYLEGFVGRTYHVPFDAIDWEHVPAEGDILELMNHGCRLLWEVDPNTEWQRRATASAPQED